MFVACICKWLKIPLALTHLWRATPGLHLPVCGVACLLVPLQHLAQESFLGRDQRRLFAVPEVLQLLRIRGEIVELGGVTVGTVDDLMCQRAGHGCARAPEAALEIGSPQCKILRQSGTEQRLL